MMSHYFIGDITAADVIKVCPFRNSVELVYLTGHHLREMLDRSAQARDENELLGGFLQFSGLNRIVIHLKFIDRKRPTASLSVA